MEYVFGVIDGQETVTTKDRQHSDLTGFQQSERVYEDQEIIDHFRVLRKVWSGEDSAGNCYDRYTIDRHYRVIDKTKGVKAAIAQTAADLDYLYMMTANELPNEAATEGGAM